MKHTFLAYICLLCACFFHATLPAQISFPKNGTYDERAAAYAFTNATIVTPEAKLEKATLVIRKGKIVAVGNGVTIPDDAITVDVQGNYIYPSFIELYSSWGLPAAKSESEPSRHQLPQYFSNKKGAYSWNEALKTEFNAAEHFSPAEADIKELRNMGFGVALVHRADGISRGTGALVALGNDKAHELLLREKAAHHLSFKKGSSGQAYPSSLMGCIALLRQTYYDAQWYASQKNKEETNLSLAAWNDVQALPQVFEAQDKLDVLRIAQLAKEFNTFYIVKGNGDEYQRLDAIKATRQPLIVPLKFPDALDVEDPYDALEATYGALKHWQLAPTNLARLAEAQITFAITSQQVEKGKFMANLRKAIEYGLSEKDALTALTKTPARLLKVDDQVGTLEAGKWANFLIASGNIFDEKTILYQNWVQGKPFEVNDLKPAPQGIYQLQVGSITYPMTVTTQQQDIKATLTKDTLNIPVTVTLSPPLISLSFEPTTATKQAVRLSGYMNSLQQWQGNGINAEGQSVAWSATYQQAAPTPPKDTATTPTRPTLERLTYPFAPFGWQNAPENTPYIIRNATVWTNEAEGIVKNTDVLLAGGQIKAIGKNLSAPSDAKVIDGTGKHLTAGIIDEHSHIAISRGVNEGSSQESTAEVRIGDVLNSEDVNIYRQLSGGVTTTHLLHGSANPIGGQTALIKLRWGQTPEGLKFGNDHRFIKFALGENVKQANWGDLHTSRFPQTRMGVEQVYDDYFTRAREYDRLKKSGKPYRKDLDLEAIAEILNKERFITCHSYVQSEINMLMKMAEKHNFRVNTFTHILEGYKVADKMAKHGAGGSSFSDWWAYKFEVYEAIPHNGAILHEQGVLVAFNSDDAEMARRLNQEAGKAMQYGNVPAEEAWKFVTLNPAKLLHIDNRVGSIKVGKDADVVLWSDEPMSIYAKAEMTWVDGIKYFDRAQDVTLREQVRAERHRLIQQMLTAKKKGEPTTAVKPFKQHLYHCDDEEDEGH